MKRTVCGVSGVMCDVLPPRPSEGLLSCQGPTLDGKVTPNITVQGGGGSLRSPFSTLYEPLTFTNAEHITKVPRATSYRVTDV